MKKTLLFIIIFISTDALSFEKITNFTFEKFEKAKIDGKTIVIHSWNKNCRHCAKQSKILASAHNDFEDVEFLFYEQTKYKKIAIALDVKFWGTIVVYKGQNEIDRKIGLVEKKDIYQLIKKGI
jgi:thiol-disulfide isomerase/thioredoxin